MSRISRALRRVARNPESAQQDLMVKGPTARISIACYCNIWNMQHTAVIFQRRFLFCFLVRHGDEESAAPFRDRRGRFQSASTAVAISRPTITKDAESVHGCVDSHTTHACESRLTDGQAVTGIPKCQFHSTDVSLEIPFKRICRGGLNGHRWGSIWGR
jgi:hypothetical protein